MISIFWRYIRHILMQVYHIFNTLVTFILFRTLAFMDDLCIMNTESLFRGGVKFPTGGKGKSPKARERRALHAADLVKFQSRRYSKNVLLCQSG